MAKIIMALDYSDTKQVFSLLEQLDPTIAKVKIGKELFVHAGPDLVKKVVAMGFDVFLDLKFHDIPNTVAAACQRAADLGVWMMNVHASGGRKMLEAAKQALLQVNAESKLIAVTVLTSLSDEDLLVIGITDTPQQQVLRLAKLTKESGLDGVVCSPQEVTLLRQQIPTDFLLVTPGVRPQGAALGDQQRVMTPQAAMQSGASYLVIGRPITQAKNPLQVLQQIQQDILG